MFLEQGDRRGGPSRQTREDSTAVSVSVSAQSFLSFVRTVPSRVEGSSGFGREASCVWPSMPAGAVQESSSTGHRVREAHEHAIAEKHNPDHSNVIRPRRGYLSTHAMKHSCTIRALLPVLRGCHLWALRIAQAKDSGAVRQYCTIRCPRQALPDPTRRVYYDVTLPSKPTERPAFVGRPLRVSILAF